MSWFIANYGMVSAVLLGILEAVSMIPGVGASGYVKFMIMVFKWLSSGTPVPTPDQAALDSKTVPINPHK